MVSLHFTDQKIDLEFCVIMEEVDPYQSYDVWYTNNPDHVTSVFFTD